ncbi:hypothetical protein [Kalamiella sp. sgz302252]|uniref:hypothetical protein n=1 Tax=Pantoea sp. sgz302252 TaxID=3341827 RepID=UPI0036D338B9
MNHQLYDAIPTDTRELCDQCLALAWSITELTNPLVRDTLHWVLLERLQMLSVCFASEDELLTA